MKQQKQPRRATAAQRPKAARSQGIRAEQQLQPITTTLTFSTKAILSLVLLALGAIILVFQPIAPSRALYVLRHYQDFQSLSTSALRNAAVGSEVLIEGHIWEGSQPQFRSFVAYIHESYSGKNWMARDWKIPSLTVVLPDGQVQVANTNYHLLSKGLPVEWRPELRLFSQSERYRGLEPGDAVVVLGRVSQQGGGKAIIAEYITGGGRAQLREALQHEPAAGDNNVIIGSGLVVGGGWVLLVSAIQAAVASRRSRGAPSV